MNVCTYARVCMFVLHRDIKGANILTDDEAVTLGVWAGVSGELWV